MQSITSVEELSTIRDEMDSNGKKLVFTNGCFDILHVGHVRYLNQARELGDALLVGLNSDASVTALKGPNRPVNNEADRAEVLLALACVDYVAVFQGERCTDLISAVRPHIYTKGGDYTEDSLERSEYAALKAAGSEIKILPLVPGKSTTNTIESLNKT